MKKLVLIFLLGISLQCIFYAKEFNESNKEEKKLKRYGLPCISAMILHGRCSNSYTYISGVKTYNNCSDLMIVCMTLCTEAGYGPGFCF